MVSLPIGILKEINGKAYVIAIDQARFTPQGAFFPGWIEDLGANGDTQYVLAQGGTLRVFDKNSE
jgi:hypothetical protein